MVLKEKKINKFTQKFGFDCSVMALVALYCHLEFWNITIFLLKISKNQPKINQEWIPKILQDYYLLL